MIRHIIPNGVHEMPLKQYLKRAWPLMPGFVLRDLLKKRDVRGNGVKLGGEDTVRGGEEIWIYAPDKYLLPTVEVLFDDGHLMAAVKPQGLPSLPDADGVGADTMQTRLEHIHPEARLVHRLDAGTGGVMLAALDDETYDRAFEAFKNHQIDKQYAALLCHRPNKGKLVLHAYLQKDAKHANVRVTDVPLPGSKPIETHIRVLRAQGDFWRVAMSPITGRTHQLRAHAAHIRCPILGDDRYGDRDLNRKYGMERQLCLWCEEIGIPEGSPLHAYVGMEFRADAPEWVENK